MTDTARKHLSAICEGYGAIWTVSDNQWQEEPIYLLAVRFGRCLFGLYCLLG
ncbi:MAG: hypothetical protein ACLUDG_06605 [Butyricicoccus sp.]